MEFGKMNVHASPTCRDEQKNKIKTEIRAPIKPEREIEFYFLFQQKNNIQEMNTYTSKLLELPCHFPDWKPGCIKTLYRVRANFNGQSRRHTNLNYRKCKRSTDLSKYI